MLYAKTKGEKLCHLLEEADLGSNVDGGANPNGRRGVTVETREIEKFCSWNEPKHDLTEV